MILRAQIQIPISLIAIMIKINNDFIALSRAVFERANYIFVRFGGVNS